MDAFLDFLGSVFGLIAKFIATLFLLGLGLLLLGLSLCGSRESGPIGGVFVILGGAGALGCLWGIHRMFAPARQSRESEDVPDAESDN